MKLQQINKYVIAVASAFALLIAGGLIYAAKLLTPDTSPTLAYFQGEWSVELRGNPNASFLWGVRTDLGGEWVVGVVQQNGKKVSTDLWRRDGQGVERFAFTADGAFVRLRSGGWESNRMVLAGSMSRKGEETKIRETITRLSDDRFTALWERESADGRWEVFSDEVCWRR